MEKQCFKCKRFLPITEFYKHPAMADGRLGKCRKCARKDVGNNYRKRKPKYQAYERQRLQRSERKEQALLYQRRRRLLSPEKSAARHAVSNAIRDGRLQRKPCEVCGTTIRVQAHHHDYSKPLDVQWLCFKHHREEHGQQVQELNEDYEV